MTRDERFLTVDRSTKSKSYVYEGDDLDREALALRNARLLLGRGEDPALVAELLPEAAALLCRCGQDLRPGARTCGARECVSARLSASLRAANREPGLLATRAATMRARWANGYREHMAAIYDPVKRSAATRKGRESMGPEARSRAQRLAAHTRYHERGGKPCPPSCALYGSEAE